MSWFYVFLWSTLFFILDHFFNHKKLLSRKMQGLFLTLLFILGLGLGGVQNDGYDRLKKWTWLEERAKLEKGASLKKNFSFSPVKAPTHWDIPQNGFKDLSKFKSHLKKQDIVLKRMEEIFLGGCLAFLWISFFPFIRRLFTGSKEH